MCQVLSNCICAKEPSDLVSPAPPHLLSNTTKKKTPILLPPTGFKERRGKRCMRAPARGVNLSHPIERHLLLLSPVDSAGSYRTGSRPGAEVGDAHPDGAEAGEEEDRTGTNLPHPIECHLPLLSHPNAVSFYFLLTKPMGRCSKT